MTRVRYRGGLDKHGLDAGLVHPSSIPLVIIQRFKQTRPVKTSKLDDTETAVPAGDPETDARPWYWSAEVNLSSLPSCFECSPGATDTTADTANAVYTPTDRGADRDVAVTDPHSGGFTRTHPCLVDVTAQLRNRISDMLMPLHPYAHQLTLRMNLHSAEKACLQQMSQESAVSISASKYQDKLEMLWEKGCTDHPSASGSETVTGVASTNESQRSCFEVVRVLRNQNLCLWKSYQKHRPSAKSKRGASTDTQGVPLRREDTALFRDWMADHLDEDENECYLLLAPRVRDSSSFDAQEHAFTQSARSLTLTKSLAHQFTN